MKKYDEIFINNKNITEILKLYDFDNILYDSDIDDKTHDKIKKLSYVINNKLTKYHKNLFLLSIEYGSKAAVIRELNIPNESFYKIKDTIIEEYNKL